MRTITACLGSVVVVAALLLPAAAAAQAFPQDQDLQLMLEYLVEDGEAPGVVLGVVEADGSTRIFAAGTGGPGSRPLGPRSVFEIGSINKTFTGALLAEMVAAGDLELDDPVDSYLPDHVRVPALDGRRITLLDLATHRSGLPRLPANLAPADRTDPYADYTIEKLYAFLSGHDLRRAPDSEAEYSNLGFGLLGHALARAAGSAYAELLEERILDPLDMEMTGYALEGDIEEWSVKGFAGGDVVPYWFTTEAIQGAGGLRSNMADMLAYLKAHIGPPDDGLERALRAAYQPRRPMADGDSIGLGWQLRRHEGRRVVTHGGATAGFSTRIGFDPERRVGFVLLANSGDFGDDLGLDFLLLGPPLSLAEVSVPAGTLADYVGEYHVPGLGRTVVRLEDRGWLTIEVPRNVRFRMYAESDTSFFVKRAPWRFAFTRDDSGEVVRVIADLDGATRSGRKVSDEAPPPGTEPEVLDLPVTAADIARYEGTYLLELGPRTLELRIFARDGRLVSQATGQPVAPLRYQGEHVFVPSFDDSVRLVFSVEDDRATAVTLHQGGAVVRGERQP